MFCCRRRVERVLAGVGAPMVCDAVLKTSLAIGAAASGNNSSSPPFATADPFDAADSVRWRAARLCHPPPSVEPTASDGAPQWQAIGPERPLARRRARRRGIGGVSVGTSVGASVWAPTPA